MAPACSSAEVDDNGDKRAGRGLLEECSKCIACGLARPAPGGVVLDDQVLMLRQRRPTNLGSAEGLEAGKVFVDVFAVGDDLAVGRRTDVTRRGRLVGDAAEGVARLIFDRLKFLGPTFARDQGPVTAIDQDTWERERLHCPELRVVIGPNDHSIGVMGHRVAKGYSKGSSKKVTSGLLH